VTIILQYRIAYMYCISWNHKHSNTLTL